MKLKFRRKKPFIKIMEKGDLQRIAKQKMIKASKMLGIDPGKPTLPVAKPGNDWKEIKPLIFFCPLCKQPLTRENTHDVFLNGERTAVHKTCPEI